MSVSTSSTSPPSATPSSDAEQRLAWLLDRLELIDAIMLGDKCIFEEGTDGVRLLRASRLIAFTLVEAGRRADVRPTLIEARQESARRSALYRGYRSIPPSTVAGSTPT